MIDINEIFRLWIEPELDKRKREKSSTYNNWARIHDFFQHSGITSFRPSEIVRKVLSVKNGLNSVMNAQPDNLRAGLSRKGKIKNYHNFWNCVNTASIL